MAIDNYSWTIEPGSMSMVINKNMDDVISWCIKNYQDGFDYRSQFPSYRWTFTFNTPEELTLFQLRWQ